MDIALTPDQVRLRFRNSGITFTQWANDHGYKRHAVYRVLNGFDKALYGQVHEIATKLGLKLPINPDTNALGFPNSCAPLAAPEGHAIACTIFLADRDWHWRIDLPGGDYRHSRPYCTRERAEEALEDELDRIHHEGCYRDWPVRRPSPTDARQQGEG